MLLYTVGIVALIFIKDVIPQISNTRLVDAGAYFTRVVQEVVYDLEEKDWCNFRIPEIHQHINLAFYGWQAEMDVHYRNGFLVSLDHIDIRQDTVSSMLASEHAWVAGQVHMHNVVTGYDVTALTSDGQQHFTGLFRHLRVEFRFEITKLHSTNEITTIVQNIGIVTVPDNNRIQLLPENNITEVMSRVFLASTGDMSGWAAVNMAPVLDEVAKTRVEFPRLCYNCVG